MMMIFSFLTSAALSFLVVVSPTTTQAADLFAPNWVVPSSGQPYPSMEAFVGDTITFAWSAGTHDVYIHPTHTCSEEGRVLIGTTADNPTTYEFQPEDGSVDGTTHTFVCDVGMHCELGMYMNVTVFATDDPTDAPTTVAPTEAPTPEATTPAPTTVEPTIAPTPNVTNPVCYVCGNEEDTLIRPDAFVSLPTNTGDEFTVQCSQAYSDGLNGVIPVQACEFVSEGVQDICGCAPPDYTCNICDPIGDSLFVTLPDGVPEVPGQPPRTCSELDEAGQNRLIPPDECSELNVYAVEACGCAPAGFNCSICGPDWEVTLTDAEIEVPFYDDLITCGELQTQGASGQLGPAQCTESELIARNDGECGCIPVGGFATCSVCGDDSETLSPNRTLDSPGFADDITCGTLQEAGASGLLNPVQCTASQVAAAANCDCAPIGYTCSVCGENAASLSPETNITVPGLDPVNCGAVETAGLDGMLTPAECAIVGPVAQAACNCAPIGWTCSICGEGFAPTNLNATFIPDDDQFTCGDAHVAGKEGMLGPNVCSLYVPLAVTSCGCEVDTSTPAPVEDPTAAPVDPSVPTVAPQPSKPTTGPPSTEGTTPPTVSGGCTPYLSSLSFVFSLLVGMVL